MSHLQLLRLLISDRLTAAANEIFGAVERTIAEYEEELSRFKLESNHQHRPPEVVLKHEIQLHCADPPQLSVCEEDLPLETPQCEQEWSPEGYYNNPSVISQDQPQPPQVKQERQEPWSRQEEEELQGQEDADATNFPFAPTCVRSCIYQEDLTQLQAQDVVNEDGGGDPLPSTSAEQMKAYSDGEDHGKSDPSGECQPLLPDCSVAQSHAGPRSVLKKPKELRMSKGHKLRRRTPAGNNVFTKGRDLELHHRPQPERQRREKAYCCGVCGKEFTHSAHLITHTRIHTGERLYSCKVCGKEFRHGHSVIVHMRIHREEKPYCCQLCGKQFRQVGNLNVHMRVHTGERPYSCKVCGKRFSRNNLMTNHMAMHAGESLYVKSGRKESVGMHA